MRGGDLELANEAGSFARMLAERNPGVATIAGIAVQVNGLLNGDVHLLRRAVELLGGSQRQLVRADAAVDLGAMELATGRRDAGAAALDGAWDTYNRLGAHGEARKVQRLLERAGVRRRRWRTTTVRPLEGWAALTETERRVARMIAESCHSSRKRRRRWPKRGGPSTAALRAFAQDDKARAGRRPVGAVGAPFERVARPFCRRRLRLSGP